MKILNLYAGLCGNRKTWGKDHDVTNVELDENTHQWIIQTYPNDKNICGDATEYLENHWQDFDFIWASPPCLTHSKFRYAISVGSGQKKHAIPDMSLYGVIKFLEYLPKKYRGQMKYVVENVQAYYQPLIQPTAIVGRHWIWANFHIKNMRIKTKISQLTSDGDVQLKGINNFGINIGDYFGVKNLQQKLRNRVDRDVSEHIWQALRLQLFLEQNQQADVFDFYKMKETV